MLYHRELPIYVEFETPLHLSKKKTTPMTAIYGAKTAKANPHIPNLLTAYMFLAPTFGIAKVVTKAHFLRNSVFATRRANVLVPLC